MWVKQCHKPPICEWFIPPIYGDLGDGLLNCCFTHINSFIDLNPQNAPYKMGHAPWTWPPSQTVFDDPKHEEPPFLSLSTIFRAMLTVSFLVPFPGSVPASELTNSQYFSNNSRWFSTIFNTSQHPKIQKIWSILVLFCVRTQPSWSSRTTGYGEDEACLLQIQGWCHRLGHGHWKRAEAQEWLGSLQWHCKLSMGDTPISMGNEVLKPNGILGDLFSDKSKLFCQEMVWYELIFVESIQSSHLEVSEFES